MQDKYRVAAQWDNTAVLQAEARADYHKNPTGSLTTTRRMPATASKQGRFVVTTHRESATQNPSVEDTAKGTTQKSGQTPVVDTQQEDDTQENRLCQADRVGADESSEPSSGNHPTVWPRSESCLQWQQHQSRASSGPLPSGTTPPCYKLRPK